MTHADEARDLLQPLQALAGRDAAFDLELAGVHATLELANQQRISNLIALASIPNQNGYENETYDARNIALFEGLFDWEDITTLPDNQDQRMIVRPDIAAALKIGDQA